MSILINMEMPKSCGECPFWEDNFKANCLATDEVVMCEYEKRPKDCPLIEVPIDYDELLKVAKAMHTWIFLNSIDEKKVYDKIGISEEMNAVLGYAGSFTVIPSDKDGET